MKPRTPPVQRLPPRRFPPPRTRVPARRLGLVAALVLASAGGCARVATAPQPSADGGRESATVANANARARTLQASSSSLDASADLARADSALDAGRALEPDGNDDEEDPGAGAAPTSGRWEKVGTPPLALTRICDLTPFRGALYAAHANQPLGTDGATVTRYRPNEGQRPFSVAFDWNRPGEPTKGGGAGQGFVRVHAIGGRLFVPDADPPYGGLGLVDQGTEGYVFVSDDKGSFAAPRAPHFRPPGAPELRPLADAGARAGAGVLPRAYHVLDVIRYRGAFYASTGSVPPTERAWRGASPGALHRASEDGARWTYEVDYPFPWQNGVWRLTYMVRFKDRLYAGIQDYDRRDPNDYLVFSPPPASEPNTTVLKHEDAHPTRVTPHGSSATLRWWVDSRVKPARLYWLAWTAEGIGLRVTTDGDRWAEVPMPPDAGRPTDVTRFRDAVVLLTERGLYRLSGPAVDASKEIATPDGIADATATPIAPLDEDAGATAGSSKKRPKSPFELGDLMCVAPLAVLDNVLYAGGQRGGSLYRLAE